MFRLKSKSFLFFLITLFLVIAFVALLLIISVQKIQQQNFQVQVQSIVEAAKGDISSEIIKAFEASYILSESLSLKEWFSNNSNPVYKEIFLTNLQSLMDDRGYESAFVAQASTRNYFEGLNVTDLLTSDDPDDSWFFDTIGSKKKININLDYYGLTNRTTLWVNTLIYLEDEILGVTGVGLNIDDFMNRMKERVPGKNSIVSIVDETNLIKISTNSNYSNKSLEVILPAEISQIGDYRLQQEFILNGKRSIIVESSIKYTDLRAVLIIREADFFPSLLKISRITLYTILILFILFIFFSGIAIYNLNSKSLEQESIQELTILSMSLLAELRDNETGTHIIRTKEYCNLLAIELKKKSEYRKYLTNKYMKALERSSPLHDIGKVGIPDSILFKPGKLTEEEFEIIKDHTVLGANVLLKAVELIKFDSYFSLGIQLVRHHHENWDGSGYPDGLSGNDIPLSARIMAVADVYDALRTKRSYKEAISHDDAVKHLIEQKYIKFDPEIIDVFIGIEAVFNKISSSN